MPAATENVPYRPLGKDGPLVPRMGLGFVNQGGGIYGEAAPLQERLDFLDAAYERGERFWDTADEYPDSENTLGKWFAANPEKRKDIFIATKFGVVRGNEGMQNLKIDSTPEYCKKAIEKSLKILGLDYVDLYYIHRLDLVTPVEKTMKAMAELKAAGKIKHIGMSECSAESLRRAHAVSPVSCVQLEYSAFCKVIEDARTPLLKTARELGIALVAYCPLGNGILTGTLRKREDFTGPGDLRGMIPWLSEENLAKNLALVDKISDMAKSKDVTPAQLSLAWVLAQGDDIFPIPGTTKISRLAENLQSLQVRLTVDEEAAIREITREVSGKRVQELNKHHFADTPPLS